MVEPPEDVLRLVAADAEVDGVAFAVELLPHVLAGAFPAVGDRVADEDQIDVPLSYPGVDRLVPLLPCRVLAANRHDGRNRFRILGRRNGRGKCRPARPDIVANRRERLQFIMMIPLRKTFCFDLTSRNLFQPHRLGPLLHTRGIEPAGLQAAEVFGGSGHAEPRRPQPSAGRRGSPRPSPPPGRRRCRSG